MSTQMTPAQMVAQFKLWKVDLHLYPGYATRGYGPGSISDVEGVLIHHTGSDAGQSDDYLDFLFNRGRPPQVPPPLCNWATDMDGDLWLGACERANHAGEGSSATLSKVELGNYPWSTTEIRPGVDNINGNSRYYGNEVRFDGGQPMTRAQWVTAVLSSAACCDFHNWGAWHVIGHKEHTSRKPDPGSTHMYEFRRDVAAALKAGPGNWPVAQQEDEMGVTPSDVVGLDTDGTVMTMGEMSARLNYIYKSVLSGGVVSTKLDGIATALDDFVSVMQGRYGRSEDVHEAEMAAIQGVLSPLQVLANHEDVDDALVRTKLDALSAAVALLPKV